MIFKKLSVQHFKRLKNSTLDFTSGINVIKGENETGKSTIKLAFLTALFASPRSEAVARDVRSWGTDFKSRLTLQFETESSGWALNKDFQEKEAVLVDGKSKRKYEDPSSVQKVLSEILGIGSQSLFESTAYIDHTMVSDISKGRKEIRESLGASLTGAGEDTSAEQIIKKLDKNIKDMEKGLVRPTTKPGVVRALKDEVSGLEERVADLKKATSELEKGASTFEGIVEELNKTESELSLKKELYESNKRYHELKGDHEKLKRNYVELEHRIEGVKEDQKKLEKVDEKLKGEGVEQKSVPNWVVYTVGGAGIMLLSGVLALFYFWLLLLSLLAVPLFVYSFITIQRRKKAVKEEERVKQLLNERKVIEASLQGKLGKKSVQELESEWSDVRRKLKDVEEELEKPELRASTVSPAEFQKMSNSIKTLEKKREDLIGRKGKGEAYLEARKGSESEISELEEQLEEKSGELARQERKLEVFKVAKEAIEGAFSKTLSPARDVLKQKVSEYFKIITGGRYEKIGLEEGTLEFRVYSPEKRDWVSISPKDDELSRGTIDQFFLAARLALVDVVSAGKKPPIFLDDPFVTFDSKRLKASMDLLKKISRDHQVFIFTCKDSYDKWADNAVPVAI